MFSADPTPYQLAYDASIRAIEDQARVLESLRSRAGTILAATALVTSFLGGQAISRARQADPGTGVEIGSVSGAAVALFIVLALLTLAILLPYRMRFSLSAAAIIDIVDSRGDENPVSPVEAYREIALRHESMYDFNARRIRPLLWCFRVAILCLVGGLAYGSRCFGGNSFDGEELRSKRKAAASMAGREQARHARRRLAKEVA